LADDLDLDAIADRARARRQAMGAPDDSFVHGLTGTFERSRDGDTIEISKNGIRRPVRFSLIDAPESAQALGKPSQDYLDSLIADNPEIERGSIGRDKYGRDVSSVYAGGKNLEVEMVRGGMAKIYPGVLDRVEPGLRQQLIDAETEARSRGEGVWAPDYEDADAARRRLKEQFGDKAMSIGHTQQEARTDAESMDEIAARARLKRYGMPGGDGDAIPRNLDPNRPKGSDIYTPEDGWLDHALGALDYAGNISRSAIKGLLTPGDGKALAYAKQAASKERFTSPENLKDVVTNKVGLGKVRVGKDDGEFDAGDIADAALDFGVGVVTDPLTAVSAGMGRLAQGAKTAGLVAKAEPALKAGLGALYGVGASDRSDDAFTKGAKATAGAAAVLAGGKAAPYLGRSLRQGFDKAADWYAVSTRGPEFEGFSRLRKVEAEAKDRISNLAEEFRQGRFEALDGLGDGERARVDTLMESFKDELVGRVNSRLESLGASANDLKDPTTYVPGSSKWRPAGLPEKVVMALDDDALRYHPKVKEVWQAAAQKHYNNIVREETEAVAKSVVEPALAEESVQIANAVSMWEKHNANIVQRFNRVIHGIPSGLADDTGLGIVGLRWHVPDVVVRDSMQDAKRVLGELKLRRASSEVGSVDARVAQTMDQRYEKYSEDLARQFATKQERHAIKMMGQYFNQVPMWNMPKALETYGSGDMRRFSNAKQAVETNRSVVGFLVDELAKNPGDLELRERFGKAKKLLDESLEYQKTVAHPVDAVMRRNSGLDGVSRGWEKALSGFDKLTNFAKTNMLYFSTSWMKNNYFDNLAKAFVENGWYGLGDAAFLGKFQKGLTSDVSDFLRGGVKKAYTKDAPMKEMVRYGVLDNPMFKSLADVKTRRFYFSPEEIAAYSADNGVGKLSQKWVQFLGDTVGHVGSVVEGTARATTYMRAKASLLELPKFRGQDELAARAAAKLVKDTFFDYGDITHFEHAVFKRMIPFYSFYSKNVPYWVKATVDPARAGRVATLEHARRSVGKTPDSYDREGLSPYIAENAPMRLGMDRQGNKIYGTVPSSSMMDAFRMLNPKSIGYDLVDKMNVLPKTAYELGANKDLFSGGPLLPYSEKEDGEKKKYLYSRGHALRFLPDVKLDARGNPYTSNPWVVRADKVASAVFPHGFVDQVAGSIGKNVTGKEKPWETIVDRLSPMELIKLSPEMERMVRLQKEKARE
jgi:endonuclease YncB( thermonuclease family)